METNLLKVKAELLKYELNISKLAKRTSDLTIQAVDRSEFYDSACMINEISGGQNVVSLDALGRPSIYQVFYADERATTEYLSGAGSVFTNSNSPYPVHPAFIINGKLKPRYLYSKYNAINWNGNKAVSLPGFELACNITYDESVALCKVAAGVSTATPSGVNGIHMMTRAEIAYLGLLQARTGFTPRGNTTRGKSEKANEWAMFYNTLENYDAGLAVSGRRLLHSITGSCPMSWQLGYSPFGAELRPGVAIWQGGYRTLGGELNIFKDNDAAIPSADHSAASESWKGIMPDGTLVTPGTAGTYKYDYTTEPGNGKVFQIVTEFAHRQTESGHYGHIAFNSLTRADGVEDNLLLQLMLFEKLNVGLQGVVQMMNYDGTERMPYGLGHDGDGSSSGPAYSNGNWNGRGARDIGIGFRFGSWDNRHEVI